jgi:hypothetical protein
MGLASLGRRGGDFGDTPAPVSDAHTGTEICPLCRLPANFRPIEGQPGLWAERSTGHIIKFVCIKKAP